MILTMSAQSADLLLGLMPTLSVIVDKVAT